MAVLVNQGVLMVLSMALFMAMVLQMDRDGFMWFIDGHQWLLII